MGAVEAARVSILILQDSVNPVPNLGIGDAFQEGFQVAREHPDQLIVLEAEGPELESPMSALCKPAEERVVKGRVPTDLNLQGIEERSAVIPFLSRVDQPQPLVRQGALRPGLLGSG